MRTALHKALVLVWLYMTSQAGIAQAYPDSSASWCSLDANGSTLTQIHVIMEADPDTAILGQNYKRIEAYNTDGWFGDPVLVQRFYVRSDPSGKGYVMLLDSMQEYLAIDVNATTGDTVAGVLVGFSTGSDPYYEIKSVVVDSVLVIENNGITVNRQFVHAIGWPPLAPYIEYYMFWQAGIGNSIGPLLQLGMVYGDTEPICLRIQDNYVYSEQSGNPGLPGIPCDCSLSTVGIEELHSSNSAFITPNPATGFFTVHAGFVAEKGTATVRVYGPTGSLALSATMQGPERRMDASGLHGLYMVVVESNGVQKTGKIVLQ